MKDLKQRTIRGGLARVLSQAATLVLRAGSLMIMAHILDPDDFGLVGMVTAMIGIFSIFRDFGLSAAAIQRTSITDEQSSTLFWINLLAGAILSLIALAMGPFVAEFYHEKQLTAVTAVLATAFLFNAAGVQHGALLERQMRFVALSVIDIASLFVGAAIGVIMALRGFGYWSLVVTSTVTPLVYSICVWVASGWVPGRPRRNTGIRSMMRFGGTLTLYGLVTYVSRNLDKVLLGRFWGVEALGIYGRAYQLVNIPTDNLTSSAGGVVFAALSRLQGEPDRLRSYFLKGYTLLLSLTVPIALMCGIFGGDIIHVFLGHKWMSAVPVFRLLAPMTLGVGILTPVGGLLASCGLVDRILKIALINAPLLIGGYSIGLHWGPEGVALAFSVVMILSVIPLIAWAVRGTPVSIWDLLRAIGRPLASGVVAAGIAFGLQVLVGSQLSPLLRLSMGVVVMSAIYLGMLLYVMRQKHFYLEIIRGFITAQQSDGQLIVPS